MKRLIIALFVGALGGTAAGFAAGIFIYPFWFLNEAASETLAGNIERQVLASGEFIHVDPSDPVHWGKGTTTLYREDSGRTLVHLQDDFEVGPGPRFHLYLVDAEKVDSKQAFLESEMLDLGRLRAFRGSQVYDVPAGTDLARYRSLVVWCKEFGVLISPASLERAQAQGLAEQKPAPAS